MLQETTKEVLSLSRRQISENNDYRLVFRILAIDRLSGQEQLLVALNELDDICRAAAGASLGGSGLLGKL